MTKTTYDKRSPYSNTSQTNKYIDYLDIWTPRQVPTSSNDLLINLDSKYKFRPDLLSYDLYGTPQLWWIFSIRNPDILKDPIYDMKPGITIYAPDANVIGSYI